MLIVLSDTQIEAYRLSQLPNDINNVKDAFTYNFIARERKFSEVAVNLMGYEKCHEYFDFNSRIRFGILDNEICTSKSNTASNVN